MCKSNAKYIARTRWGDFVNMFLHHLQYDLSRSSETISGYKKDLYHFGNYLITEVWRQKFPVKL